MKNWNEKLNDRRQEYNITYHIWTLILFPSTTIVFILKSIPVKKKGIFFTSNMLFENNSLDTNNIRSKKISLEAYQSLIYVIC